MIKAKKGLLITLFAAMMIFAFGATSAFAADQPTWSEDYTKVTVDASTGAPDNYTYNTVRTYNSTTGQIDVTIDPSTDVGWALPTVTTSYYDLNNAVIAKNGTAVSAVYTNGYTFTGTDGLKFNVPDYVTNKTATVAPVKALDASGLNSGNWQGQVKGYDAYDSTVATEQNFTLTLDVTFNSNAATYNFYGVVPAKDVKVLARAANAGDVLFFEDEVSAKPADAIAKGSDAVTKAVQFAYDGAAHKVVNNTIEGLTVSYEVFNKTTGKYDAVSECPTVTNVGDEAIVKAITSWTETTVVGDKTTTETKKITNTFNLSVKPAKAPTFGFDKDGNVGNYQYKVEGAEFDAYAYIIATAADDASKDAVAANEETLKEYFKDFYEVTSTATKADPNTFDLAMAAKKLTADDVKALEKKYEALMKNFGVASGSVIAKDSTTAKMFANSDEIMPEIEFVDSPTAMTYKAKKLKKKAASFTVTAEASNGVAVTYKLINAPQKIKIDKATGKITLAKGLKKGTYKIKVKAYIGKLYTNGNGVDIYPSETHDIKIKVKK